MEELAVAKSPFEGRIGDGSKVNIWDDNWLEGTTHFSPLVYPQNWLIWSWKRIGELIPTKSQHFKRGIISDPFLQHVCWKKLKLCNTYLSWKCDYARDVWYSALSVDIINNKLKLC